MSGRRDKNVEILDFLVEFAGGRAAFCDRTGVRAPNLSRYLSASPNRLKVTKKLLTAKAKKLLIENRDILNFFVARADTQLAFARRSGMKAPNLTKYLNGKISISQNLVERYVQRLRSAAPCETYGLHAALSASAPLAHSLAMSYSNPDRESEFPCAMGPCESRLIV